MTNIFYSIIIPVKNQQNTIKNNLLRLIKKLKKLKKMNFLKNWEIILIDDGSKDKTIIKIKKFKAKQKKLKLVINEKNRGKGYSIKRGIKFLNKQSKKIITIDADMPYLETFDKFIFELNKCNLAIIDRKNKNSKLINKKKNFYIYYRIFIGHLLNLIFRIFRLTSLKDTQAGLKGFNSSYKKIFRYIKTDGFLYDLEFLLMLEKKNIIPKLIPCRYSVSNNSSITFNLNIYWKILRDLLIIILNNFKKKYNLSKI